jgi:transcription elongation factor SPT6|tara:strand:+ start:2496 stop:2744 length:249 start_codon:yes stop_codon:yes gene_type:complete
MSTRDFFDTAAELGSEEEDEDFDEETGETRPKKTNGINGIDDSSEEEDEDDDELLAQASISLHSRRRDGSNNTIGRCGIRRR